MKKVCMIIIAIFAISGAVIAESKTQIQKAEEMLNHSNTYYWLSRARNNVLSDVNKSLEFAKSAKTILEKEKQTPKILKLIEKADSTISETENQASINSGYLWDFSQLIPLLVAEDEIYEYYDDINNIAIERSLESVCEELEKDTDRGFQLYLISLDDNKNLANEEVIHTYLNGKTSYYALTKHEILSAISQTELDDLYANNNINPIMQKLSNTFSKEGVGILRISKFDKINKVVYLGTTYSFWDSDTKSLGNNFYADGLCEQPASQWWIYLFIFIGLPITIIYNSLNKKQSKGSFPPFWYGGGVACGIAFFHYMAFMGLQAGEVIDSGAIVTSPTGLIGIGIILLIIAILPPVLSYVAAIKIKQVVKILNNPETISIIFSSSLLGSVVYLSTIGILRYEQNVVLINATVAICAILYPAFAIGKTYSKHNLQEDFLSGLQAALIAIANIALFYSFIKYETKHLVITAIALNIFTLFIHIILPKNIKKTEKEKKIKEKKDYSNLQGLKWLQKKLDEPPYFICNQPVFDKAVKWITEKNEDKKIKMVFI